MLLNKENTAVSIATDDDPYAPYGKVLVTAERTVGTNGHMIASVSIPDLEAKEFPEVGIPVNGATLKPCLLARKDVEALGKQIPRRGSLPILAHALIDVEATNESDKVFSAAVTDLETTARVTLRKQDGAEDHACNRLEKVRPEGTPAIVVGLALEPLEKVVKILKAAGVPKKNGVRVQVYDNGDMEREGQIESTPVTFQARNEYGQDIEILLMPCRL